MRWPLKAVRLGLKFGDWWPTTRNCPFAPLGTGQSQSLRRYRPADFPEATSTPLLNDDKHTLAEFGGGEYIARTFCMSSKQECQRERRQRSK